VAHLTAREDNSPNAPIAAVRNWKSNFLFLQPTHQANRMCLAVLTVARGDFHAAAVAAEGAPTTIELKYI